MSDTKRCSRCHEIKPVSDFSVYGSKSKQPGRIYSRCRACECAKAKTYYHEHHDEVRTSRNAWYAEHRDEQRIAKREVYQANREQAIERQANYNKAHRAEQASYACKWNREHPAERHQNHLRRRERYRNAPGYSTPAQIMARVEYHGWRCYYCGVLLDRSTLTLDHRIPLSRGGSNWPANYVPACMFCNVSKRDRKESEWRTSYHFSSRKSQTGCAA